MDERRRDEEKRKPFSSILLVTLLRVTDERAQAATYMHKEEKDVCVFIYSLLSFLLFAIYLRYLRLGLGVA